MCTIHNSSCCSRRFRVPIAMRRFYKLSLCIPQNLLLTNQDLHHGLLGTIKASKPYQEFFQGSSGEIHPVLGPKPALSY